MIEVKIEKRLKSHKLQIEFQSESRRVGILGASGCGKSMTLQSVAGIVTPDEGSIQIDGHVFFDSKERINVEVQKRKTGYLFQNYALFPNMTVEKNLLVGVSGLRKEEARKRVHTIMEKFELHGLEKRYPHELSGGQQQRVALARIMVYEPEVLLLDEPFSALDSYLKDNLKHEMKKILRDYQGTMIMVSHDRDEIYEFCDLLVCMDGGKLIEYGETHKVFEAPTYQKTARLTGCKNIDTITVIDENHIRATSWNLVLYVEREIEPQMTAVGIRAHHFVPAKQDEENAFEYDIVSEMETPFEIRYLIRVAGTNGTGIWWTISKQSVNHEPMPRFLKVAPEHIMLLR